jgi:hypothetical protein
MVGAYQSTLNGPADAFVTKLSCTGDSLLYSTYFGGSYYEEAARIVVDPLKCAYVAGKSRSVDMPVYNAFDSSFNGDVDVFVTKLSAEGNVLVYSTYLGGTMGDSPSGFALDLHGCAYVCGNTFSADFPTTPIPLRAVYNNEPRDAFVAKVCVAGNGETYLSYSTYLGGSSLNAAYDLTVDASGCAHVSGQTESMDFPLVDPYDSTNTSVFYAKLSSSGNTVLRMTFLGPGWFGSGVALDSAGCVYVTGYTPSSWIHTRSGFDSSYNGGGDVYVQKLCDGKCGDANADLIVDISDAVYLIAYIFSGGPAPIPLLAGDANCDQAVDISDAVHLIAYIFSGGPAPCAGC